MFVETEQKDAGLSPHALSLSKRTQNDELQNVYFMIRKDVLPLLMMMLDMMVFLSSHCSGIAFAHQAVHGLFPAHLQTVSDLRQIQGVMHLPLSRDLAALGVNCQQRALLDFFE
jgi:hypothetical protein